MEDNLHLETKSYLDKTLRWAKIKKIEASVGLFVWTVIKDLNNMASVGLEEMKVDSEILLEVLEEMLKQEPQREPVLSQEMKDAIERAKRVENPVQIHTLFLEAITAESVAPIMADNAISVDVLRSTILNIIGDENLSEEPEFEHVTIERNPLGKRVEKQKPSFYHEVKPKQIFGREKELSELEQVLLQRIKKNAIIVGHPGVGKTALVEALAGAIAQNPRLCSKRIYSLDVNGMVSGTVYRGMFEERMQDLVNQMESDSNFVLFVDEAHVLLNAGSGQNDLNLMNVLKPPMARGSIQVILATTFEEFKGLEKDKAFLRRCKMITMEEPSPKQTALIARSVMGEFERHYSMGIDDESIETLIGFAGLNRRNWFPDKALDAIDSLLAWNSKRKSSPLDARIASEWSKMIAIADSGDYSGAKQAIAAHNRLLGEKSKEPIGVIGKETTLEWIKTQNPHYLGFWGNDTKDALKSDVVGQDPIIDALVDDLNIRGFDRDSPTKGNYLFLGATSTGKTQLAKSVATHMFDNALFEINCGEYTDRHSLHRLLGADPGYIGHEQGGLLVEFIKTHTSGVILVDEAEKADPSMITLLLSLMDGKISDTKGFKAELSEFTLIVTANFNPRKPVGYGEQSPLIPKEFPREFMARIDMVFNFAPLGRSSLEMMYRRLFREFSEKMKSLYQFEPQEDELETAEILKAENARDLLNRWRGLKKKFFATFLSQQALLVSNEKPLAKTP